MGRYKSVDGRTYQTEPEPRFYKPRKPNPFCHWTQKNNDTLSAAKLIALENFLHSRHPSDTVPLKNTAEAVTTYELTFDTSLRRYTTDEETAFAKICERFPDAAAYGSYLKLLYASRYPSNPYYNPHHLKGETI